ncbi:MAG TPA: endolytic transglycosylase MltG [Clostridia bacterium]|nr:endolytic transglycosylase MltG [Clostridia bacterium]
MPRRIAKPLIILLIIVLLVGVVLAGFGLGYRYVREQDKRMAYLKGLFDARGFSPFDEDTPGAIEVYVEQQSKTHDIALMLKDKGLIGSTFAFEFLSKFNGFDGQYQYGTHYLLEDMSYDEIMVILTNQPQPVTITFPEGMTYQQMKEKMLEAGMSFNPDLLDAMVKQPGLFADYSFVPLIEQTPGREWLLQGYLWPDTYRFDVNSTEQDIIRIFLNNTERHIRVGGYMEKAEKMGMSLDRVLTLASIVQQEGPIDEMPKIAKVFLNRLEREMPLQSCATINYLRAEENREPQLWILNSDIERYRDNFYNTYRHQGLPPGPINSPGTVAIEGVLWPATERTWGGANAYLFFVAKGDGTNDFSKTAEEHQAKADRYSSQGQ